MNRFFLAAFSLIAVGAAKAADLPVKAVAPPVKTPAPVVATAYNWTGFYIGGQVGGAWGHSDVATSFDNTGGFTDAFVEDINAKRKARFSPRNVIGGVTAGYNLQFQNVVLGVELDFSSMRLDGRRALNVPFSSLDWTFDIRDEVKTNWLFAARPRLGFAFNQLLVYGTGGVAVTDLEYSHFFRNNDPFGGGIFQYHEAVSKSENRAGWIAGGGLEYAIAPPWTIKAEYLHADFGHIDAGGPLIRPLDGAVVGRFAHRASLTVDLVRFGANYRF